VSSSFPAALTLEALSLSFAHHAGDAVASLAAAAAPLDDATEAAAAAAAGAALSAAAASAGLVTPPPAPGQSGSGAGVVLAPSSAYTAPFAGVVADAAVGRQVLALPAGTSGAHVGAAPRQASPLDLRFVHRRGGGGTGASAAAATECDGVCVSAPDAHGVRHVSFSGAAVGAAGSGSKGDGSACCAPCGRDVAVDLTVPARGSLAFELQVRADAVYSRLQGGQALAFAGGGAAGRPALALQQPAGPDPIAAALLGGTLRPHSVAARQRSQHHEAALQAHHALVAAAGKAAGPGAGGSRPGQPHAHAAAAHQRVALINRRVIPVSSSDQIRVPSRLS